MATLRSSGADPLSSVRLERCTYHLPVRRQCTRPGQARYVAPAQHLLPVADCRRLQGFFGGNSTKATSGINGALTRTQVDEKVPDSVKQFYDDTLKSARDKARPDLIRVLAYKSAAAVEWLQDEFGLDLTLISRLGYGDPPARIVSRCRWPGLTGFELAATPSPGHIEATTPSSPAWPSPTR